ncbi:MULTISPECIES: LeuA family protein [Actinomadura]|uniref:2-isopropylmalate synthase n=1 Tax=Actinomadura yumaensis TaxID=111807 RepID=A0ABW2CCD3_9ACTN|nr:pyruvate carboxyltransferase [Actinomadura sp. J1-007]MWK38227.1 pyruvate carboxyltransferase [Actinomadura sp. J1-007]
MTERDAPPRRVSIFDTTLRDGEQAPGNAMNPDQKLEVAMAIEAVGVDVIEVGFPSSSPSDVEATRLISRSVTSARIATLSRATRADVDIAVEAGGTRGHHLQIMATGSEIHLRHKRGISQAEAQDEVVDAIAHARSLGVEHVTLGIEDASRGSAGLLRPLVRESVDAGADCVAVADTTGCMTPGEFGGLIASIRSWTRPDIVISAHCHEDMGLSLANALAAVQRGADEVQCTLAGIGERAGNTALEELVAVLDYRGEALGLSTSARPEGLQAAFEKLSAAIGLPAPRNKAIFGVNAFATQAGIHQAGMLRDPITYEYVRPDRFGRERTILVGRHSGRAVLRHVFDQIGRPVDEAVLEDVYREHVANRTNGECIDLAEVRGLISDRLSELAGPGGR